MSDPMRLMRDGATEFERELLRSWQREQPSFSARRRALAIAGSSVAATVAASAAARAGGSMAPKLALGTVVAKWLIVGASVGFATSAVTIHYVDAQSSTNPKPSAIAAPANPHRTEPASATETALPHREPQTLPAVPATAEGAKPRSTPKPKAAELPPEPEPVARGALGPETALLDRAREALKSGSPSRALELVGEYRQTFSNGVLAQEAEVLRIDALDRQGNRAEAKRRAERFVTHNPTSAHAERLRRIADDATIP